MPTIHDPVFMEIDRTVLIKKKMYHIRVLSPYYGGLQQSKEAEILGIFLI